MIEVEVRSLITDREYRRIRSFLEKEADFMGERNETTKYLDCNSDLRIQKSDEDAKIWLKKGALHDDAREEFEVIFNRDDFAKMEIIFEEIGIESELIWKRRRMVYIWEGINCYLDDTKGYGKIVELEKMTNENPEEVRNHLLEKLSVLGIEETPKRKFDQMYSEYKKEHQ